MKKQVLSLLFASLLLSGCTTPTTPIENKDNTENNSQNNTNDNSQTNNNNENSTENGNQNENNNNENNGNENNGNENNEPLETKEMTFAEAYAACVALENNAESTFEVKTTGFICSSPTLGTSGNYSFNISNTADNTAEYLKIYYLTSSDGEVPANGDKVQVLGKLKNYYNTDTKKNTYEYISGQYTIIERGEIGGNTGNEGEDSGHTSGGDAETNEIKSIMPTGTAIDISSGVNYSWKDKQNQVSYDNAPGWQYYWGTSFEPDGQRWGNGRDDGGIEFTRNSFIISPLFETNKKIEVIFKFHLIAHKNNKKFIPYSEGSIFKFEEYDKNGNLLSDPKLKQPTWVDSNKVDSLTNEQKEKMTIVSKIPTNEMWELTTYLDNDNCSFFVLRFNNYLPYGKDGGYTCALNTAYLKSWQYDL